MAKILNLNKDLSARFRADIAREKNIIGKKLHAARKAIGITQGDCAKELLRYGIQVQTPAVAKWEKGETVPNAYQLLALCYLLKIENGLDYFMGHVTSEPVNDPLNTEGRMLLAGYRSYLESIPKYQKNYCHLVEMKTMPVSLLPASAGLGDYLDNNRFEDMEFPEVSVPDYADFAVRIHGDSMEPAYSDGQFAWISECERLNPGEVGLFILNGDGYIKVYDEREPDEENLEKFTDSYGIVHPQVALISFNRKYDPILIAPSPDTSFRIVGRVLN